MKPCVDFPASEDDTDIWECVAQCAICCDWYVPAVPGGVVSQYALKKCGTADDIMRTVKRLSAIACAVILLVAGLAASQTFQEDRVVERERVAGEPPVTSTNEVSHSEHTVTTDSTGGSDEAAYRDTTDRRTDTSSAAPADTGRSSHHTTDTDQPATYHNGTDTTVRGTTVSAGSQAEATDGEASAESRLTITLNDLVAMLFSRAAATGDGASAAVQQGAQVTPRSGYDTSRTGTYNNDYADDTRTSAADHRSQQRDTRIREERRVDDAHTGVQRDVPPAGDRRQAQGARSLGDGCYEHEHAHSGIHHGSLHIGSHTHMHTHCPEQQVDEFRDQQRVEQQPQQPIDRSRCGWHNDRHGPGYHHGDYHNVDHFHPHRHC